MTSTWIRTLALGALVFGLAACGDTSSTATPPEPAPTAEPVLSEAEKAEQQQAMVRAEADAVRALVDRLFSDLSNQNFSAAANQFHFDPSYSSEARLLEETKVATLFWAMHEKLGGIEDTKPLPRGAPELQTFGLQVRANPEAYWKEFEPDASARTVMLAKFENAENPAQIALDLTRDSTGWKVTEFDLGLPTEQPGAEDTLRGIAELAGERLGSSGVSTVPGDAS